MSGAAEHSLYMEESASGPSPAAEHVRVDAAASSSSGPSGAAEHVRVDAGAVALAISSMEVGNEGGATEHSADRAECGSTDQQAFPASCIDTRTAVESDCAGDRPADPTFTFDLRWCSGDLIKRFENEPDLNVERFEQDMDEGLVDGIPRAKTHESGEWLEHYCICHGNAILECGKCLSDYDIPRNATLTVLLVSLGTPL